MVLFGKINKRLLTLIIFIFIGLYWSSNARAKKLEGKIFYKEETINVEMKIPFEMGEVDYAALQRGVTYYGHNNKKVRAIPSDMMGFSFEYDGETVIMLTRSKGQVYGDNAYKPNICLHLLLDGRSKLFEYYEVQRVNNTMGSGGMMVSTGGGVKYYLIIQPPGSPLMLIKASRFRSDMENVFLDCPELDHKIQNKEYRYDDLIQIVQYYNKHCSKK